MRLSNFEGGFNYNDINTKIKEYNYQEWTEEVMSPRAVALLNAKGAN